MYLSLPVLKVTSIHSSGLHYKKLRATESDKSYIGKVFTINAQHSHTTMNASGVWSKEQLGRSTFMSEKDSVVGSMGKSISPYQQ